MPPADPPQPLEEVAPAAAPAEAAADEAAGAPDEPLDEEDEEEIVVTGQRLRGAVDSDIPPEVQLNRREVRATGAGSIAELLEALAPQTRSGRGRGGGGPVVLLNGRRISGFGEIRDLPTEAIQRVDILPEEVALSYGYRADQRVVNIVLRRRFRAITGELETGFATAGGRNSGEIDLNILRLNRAGRWSLDFEYQRSGALFESERDLIQASGGAPFDLIGNVGASPFSPDAEIDPALSALAGEPVTVAAVPGTAASGAPLLADFVAGSNDPNITDLGRFRTLLPESEQVTLNGTLNRIVFGDVSATVNARLDLNSSTSRFGLPSAQLLVPADNPFSPFGSDVILFRSFDDPRPLTRESKGRSAHLGISLGGDIRPWRWFLSSNYANSRNSSRTDAGLDPDAAQARIGAGDPAVNPFGALPGDLLAVRPADRSRSVSDTFNALLVLNGPVLTLPAGPATASVRTGFDARGLRSRTLRGGLEQSRELSREQASLQVSLDLPIASRREAFLADLGNLSANLNAEVEQLSDFGTLRTIGYGLNWSPIDEINLGASVTNEDGAPTMQQLGDPVLLTPNVRVFDFVRGETVDVNRLEGGNPGLFADNRRVINLRLFARPIEDEDLSLIASYTSSRIRNPIASFPTATPEIEAAFPDRFLRDSDGRLLRIDARPVNFARSDRSEARWGINFSEPIGPQGPPRGFRGGGRFGGGRGPGGGAAGTAQAPAGQPAPAGQAGTPPGGAGGAADRPQRRGPGGGPGGGRGGFGGGGRGGFGGGGPGGFFGGGGGGGRLQLAFFHTVHLENEILIREGVPVLDLLDGSAIGNRGGQPRHEVEVQAGLFKDGLGARLTGNWRSGTRVNGVLQPGGGTSGDLFFSDLATFNLRLFADLGAQRSLVRAHPFLRSSRLSLSIDNLFDSRLGVRDESGATPLGYQPDYLDPLGRSVRVTFRKLFF